jgi:UMF1 family MFS transporter
MGPFLLGLTTTLFQSQRAGMATILIFFTIGGLLLLTVNEAKGMAMVDREKTGA